MNLSNLRAPYGSRRGKKRRGRGESSGLGKTSGRGHKGEGSRTGTGKINASFEGGQTPLVRRLPKFGFTNVFRKDRCVVNLDDLEKFDSGTTIDAEFLKKEGVLASIPAGGIKVLARGEIKKSFTVKAQAFSQKAKEAIEKAGGKVEVVK